MSTSKTYHHGDLHDALIRAALAILRSDGIAALTLRAAARKAGVSPMAPYRHFADKDALLAAVAAHGFTVLTDYLTSATPPNTPYPEALAACGAAYVGFACDEPELFRLMFGPHITKDCTCEPLETAGYTAFNALQHAVADATPHLTPQARADVALACWSLVHGLASLTVDGRLGPIDARATALRLTGILGAGFL